MAEENDRVAAPELKFSSGALSQVPPDRSPFGPPQPFRPGATQAEQLAARLGRAV